MGIAPIILERNRYDLVLALHRRGLRRDVRPRIRARKVPRMIAAIIGVALIIGSYFLGRWSYRATR
ncbi:hypothetical protein I6I68_00080 [Corynebacterium glucuronolyticum]|uniref:hypothetical protein n=1 Tax=Corynebacterium glucuronolyticum TaxID=39791 RepID=UPI00191FA24B|nr:hypothetical protein [Corynebacterium glucuronolyticum]QQU88450.1 hypothetical protein I6I68_00080 [Corynebacterium glucuronolyticum]